MAMVGVMVGVNAGVETLDVGLLVNVAGNRVAEGKGVKVWVGVRRGVCDGITEAVGVQVGGNPIVLRWVGIEALSVGFGMPEQPYRNKKMIG